MPTQKPAATPQPGSDADQAVEAVKQSADQAVETVKQGGKSVKELLMKFYYDWSLHTTQALTFVLITSVIPLAILMLALVGRIIGKLDKQAQTKMTDQIMGIFPQPIFSSTSQDIVHSAFQKLPQHVEFLTILGIIGAIVLGSRLFTLLEACFDLIYRVPQRRFKQKNLLAITMLITFMILTPVLVLASLIPEQLVALVHHTTTNEDSTLLNKIAGIASSLIVSFCLFEIIYTFIPNTKGRLTTKLRHSVCGALTASIVLEICLVLFPIYIDDYTSGLIGQVTWILGFLLFFYVIALVTLFGATVNAYYGEGIKPTSTDLITRSSRFS